MAETEFMRRVMKLATKLGARLFRNNTGQAWVGHVVHRSATEITLRYPRPLHAGLCVGSSDLVGWIPITITVDMVGKTIATFAAVETKVGRGRASKEQEAFIEAVQRAGGIAGVVHRDEDLSALFQRYLPKIATVDNKIATNDSQAS